MGLPRRTTLGRVQAYGWEPVVMREVPSQQGLEFKSGRSLIIWSLSEIGFERPCW